MKFTPKMRPVSATVKAQGTQRGYTIVELSVAVAVAGALLVGTMALVQTVLNTSRANDTISTLARSETQIEKIWNLANDYTGLTIKAAVAAGVFPDLQHTFDSSNNLTGVLNKFNRAITVDVATDLPAANQKRGYAINYSGIPTSVCADIVSAGASAGFRGIIVGAESTQGTNPTDNTKLKLDAAGTKLTAGDTSGVVAFDPSATGVKIDAMTSTTACGTSKDTVSIAFVNWK